MPLRDLACPSPAARVRSTVACLLLLAGCGGGRIPGGESDQPPDVVLFLIDTLRADWTEPGGFEGATTPHMLALAEEAVVFEEAHSPAPWTLPSVVSIFTGRHLAEHNVSREAFKLSTSIPTLTELLADYGYRTGSYYRNPFAGPVSGLDRAFEECVHTKQNASGATLDKFFDGVTSRPYFLYVHNAEPHDPHQARKKFRKHFERVEQKFLKEYGELVLNYRQATRIDYAAKPRRPLGTTDNTQEQSASMARLTELLPEIENIYSASVRDADDHLGSVIAKIKERGRWDNTLFILLADHGEEMADHGGWQHDQSLYQELIHVPLIVHLPQGEHAGLRVSTPVSLVDILSTVLDVTACPPGEADPSGTSLLPLIEVASSGGGSPEDQPLLLAIRQNQRKYYRPYKESRGDVNVAVRQGKWKAIFDVEPDRVQLFDLEADPGEQHDLASEHAELANELKAFAARRYGELLERSVMAGEGGLDRQSAATLQALRDLGYVGEEGEEEEEEAQGPDESTDR